MSTSPRWLVEAYNRHGAEILRRDLGARRAGDLAGIGRGRGQRLVHYCRRHGPPGEDLGDLEALEAQIQSLRDDRNRLRGLLRNRRRAEGIGGKVAREAFELANLPIKPPQWVASSGRTSRAAGVPTLVLSDLHWGEVVDPATTGGNAYNMTIARARLRRVVDQTIHILRDHIVSPAGYPGIVVPLGGDMVSGGIHEELATTDEEPPGACVVDLAGELIAALEVLADEFGSVFVPCVVGNHGRQTMRPTYKRRARLNWDWLLYCMIARHFQTDERVTLQVPEAPDARYTVAGSTRYLLTHGDLMGGGGGGGAFGPIGPVLKGRAKVAASNMGDPWDCLILGHWHTYIVLRSPQVVVNGSTKGPDEYTLGLRLAPSPPCQALFLTHPKHVGPTIALPVFCDEPERATAEAFAC